LRGSFVIIHVNALPDRSRFAHRPQRKFSAKKPLTEILLNRTAIGLQSNHCRHMLDEKYLQFVNKVTHNNYKFIDAFRPLMTANNRFLTKNVYTLIIGGVSAVRSV
jgi:hypothetical protein